MGFLTESGELCAKTSVIGTHGEQEWAAGPGQNGKERKQGNMTV